MEKIKNFFKEYFFFNIPKEEKHMIRSRIMENDRRGYLTVAVIIAFLQLFMFIFNIFQYGIDVPFEKRYATYYRYLYLFLLVVSLVSITLLEFFYRKKKVVLFFLVVNSFIVVTHFWSVGISFLDTYKLVHNGANSANLIVFSYVLIAVTCFIVLEPWIVILDLLSATIFLDLCIYFVPSLHPAFSSGTIINSASILFLAIFASIFNFVKRIKQLRLEIEVVELNKSLQNQAHFDELTKINNRRFLTERIDEALKIGDYATSVIIFDIDNFKKVNDNFGHQNGDICLMKLGELINEFIKDKNCYAVRYGGEEFLIRFEGINKKDIFKIVDDFRKKVNETEIVLLDDTIINISISIGLVIADGQINYQGLIQRADNMLYESKKTKNITTLYKPNND